MFIDLILRTVYPGATCFIPSSNNTFAYYYWGNLSIFSQYQSIKQRLYFKYIQEEEEYLNKLGLKLEGDISFICVPIREEDDILGTLSFHGVYNEHIAMSEDARIFSIAVSMIAQ